MTDEAWIALHVHHHGDLGALVLDGLAPTACALERDGDVRLWHHVRYWNGGPHVRIRVLPSEPRRRAAVRAALVEAAGGYLRGHPSRPADSAAYASTATAMHRLHDELTRDHPFAEAFLEPVEPFVDRDAVVERPYVFDAARYGSGELRDVAEENFAESTRLSLPLLRAGVGRPALVHAWSLRLMAALAPALSLDPSAAARLFARYRDATRYFLALGNGDGHGLRPFEEIASDVLAAIGEAQGDDDSASAAAALLARWRASLAASAERIEVASRRRRAPQRVEDLLIDYVHMMNNRLGLPVTAEAYLADALQQGYEALAR